MIFINPWASYHSDDIPDLTPHSDEELVDFFMRYLWLYYLNHNLYHTILFMLCSYKRRIAVYFNSDR